MTDAEARERLAEAACMAEMCENHAPENAAPAINYAPDLGGGDDGCAGCRRALVHALLAALASPDIPADVAGRLAGVRPVAEYRTADEWHPWDGADRYMQTRTRLVRVAPEREEVPDAD